MSPGAARRKEGRKERERAGAPPPPHHCPGWNHPGGDAGPATCRGCLAQGVSPLRLPSLDFSLNTEIQALSAPARWSAPLEGSPPPQPCCCGPWGSFPPSSSRRARPKLVSKRREGSWEFRDFLAMEEKCENYSPRPENPEPSRGGGGGDVFNSDAGRWDTDSSANPAPHTPALCLGGPCESWGVGTGGLADGGLAWLRHKPRHYRGCALGALLNGASPPPPRFNCAPLPAARGPLAGSGGLLGTGLLPPARTPGTDPRHALLPCRGLSPAFLALPRGPPPRQPFESQRVGIFL